VRRVIHDLAHGDDIQPALTICTLLPEAALEPAAVEDDVLCAAGRPADGERCAPLADSGDPAPAAEQAALEYGVVRAVDVGREQVRPAKDEVGVMLIAAEDQVPPFG
jgi:hypothetical protein